MRSQASIVAGARARARKQKFVLGDLGRATTPCGEVARSDALITGLQQIPTLLGLTDEAMASPQSIKAAPTRRRR
jgi:hypothetical protein